MMTIHALILIGVLPTASLVVGCGAKDANADGASLKDASFLAFVDDNGDGKSANDLPRSLKFSDYFATNRPATRVIMINAAAGWCGPCMHEAGGLNALAATFAPKGVAILTAVFQKPDGSPADPDFAKLWAETFQLTVPTLVDATFITRAYFDVGALPANMFVDAETTEILKVATGTTQGDDPLAEYRAWLTSYLAR